MRSRVDEPLRGGVCRREVAADERLQHLVAIVGHEGAVVRVADRAGVTRVIHPAVVPLVLGNAHARKTGREREGGREGEREGERESEGGREREKWERGRASEKRRGERE